MQFRGLIIVSFFFLTLAVGGAFYAARYLEQKNPGGTLIQTYGHFAVPWTSWTVDVSPAGMTLGERRVFGAETADWKDSPPNWIPHPGWFIFVKGRDTWAYDGAGLIRMERITQKAAISYEFGPHRDSSPTWGVIPQPPKEVFDRLPPLIQKVIRQRFPAIDNVSPA